MAANQASTGLDIYVISLKNSSRRQPTKGAQNYYVGTRLLYKHGLGIQASDCYTSIRPMYIRMGFALCRRPPLQTASFNWLMLFGLFRPFDIVDNVEMSEIVNDFVKFS